MTWLWWMAGALISGACGFWAGHVVGEMKSQGRADQMLERAMVERRRQKWEQNLRRLERADQEGAARKRRKR